jgi:hypothetical protein
MKGFTEQRGRVTRTVFDKMTGQFMLQDVPHPFLQTQPESPAATADIVVLAARRKPKLVRNKLEKHWQAEQMV